MIQYHYKACNYFRIATSIGFSLIIIYLLSVLSPPCYSSNTVSVTTKISSVNTAKPLPSCNSGTKNAALKAKEVNWRSGPGAEHPITWIYKSPGWPVIIKRKCNNWYLVQDYEGTQGWVSGPMLTFKPIFMIAEQTVSLKKNTSKNSAIAAYLTKGVLVYCYKKHGEWCLVSVNSDGVKVKGWVPKAALWPGCE